MARYPVVECLPSFSLLINSSLRCRVSAMDAKSTPLQKNKYQNFMLNILSYKNRPLNNTYSSSLTQALGILLEFS